MSVLEEAGGSSLVLGLLRQHCGHDTLATAATAFLSNCCMTFQGRWQVHDMADLFSVRASQQRWFVSEGGVALALEVGRGRRGGRLPRTGSHVLLA